MYGYGEVSCASAHQVLRVVVGLARYPGGTVSQERTCYSTSICSKTVSQPYYPGYQWQTRTSGYVDNWWNAYYQSDWVTIP